MKNANPITFAPIKDMSPDELRRIGMKLNFGEDWGWQRQLAHRLECNERTVRKWFLGENPISGHAALLLRLLAEDASRTKRPKMC